jgi:O-acetyl-ADP-ribose deacetylase (regulator of RNase III)/uncharacterized protein YwgA
MVNVVIGNILESKAQTLVNTVNCVGIMGKGIALMFKTQFPDMFKDYVERCNRGEVRLGRPYLYRRLMTPWILNFPTKDHWRSVANLNAIIEELGYLQDHYQEWGITSLAVPPLGCGEGQLEWRVVGPTLYQYLSKLNIPVELHAPYGTPSMETQSSFLEKRNMPVIADASLGTFKIQPDWVAIVEILSKIESEPYHWPIGRTTFQKIAYFATQAGLETSLTFEKGSYGPHAKDLKLKLTQLVNNSLIYEERLGQMFRIRVGPTFANARQSYQKSVKEKEKTIDRVVDLFLRIRTQQAEVAATVHFAARVLTEEIGRKPSEKEVLDYVLKWKQRRHPPIDISEVASTIRNLAVLGWISVNSSEDLPTPDDYLAVV